MNAWTIYWVMQLDVIVKCLIVLAFVLLIVSAISLFEAYVLISDQDFDRLISPERADKSFTASKRFFSLSKRFFIAFICCCIAISVIPSSRTAASMIILPAIANNDQIKHEAADLYGLAKQALENIAKKD